MQQHRALRSLSPLGAAAELIRPMSASSLLLARLACICTPLASVVARTSFAAVEAKAAEVPLPPSRSSLPPSKCLDTCVKAGDAICQDRGAVARLASGASLGPTGPTAAPAPSQTRLIPALGAGRTTHQMWYTTQMVGRGRWQNRAWAGCLLKGQNWREWTEGCGTLWVPATQFTVSFPVAGTIDLAASTQRGPPDTSLWADAMTGVGSYCSAFCPTVWCGQGGQRRRMWKIRPVWPAGSAQQADWPRLVEAPGSRRHGLAQRAASRTASWPKAEAEGGATLFSHIG